MSEAKNITWGARIGVFVICHLFFPFILLIGIALAAAKLMAILTVFLFVVWCAAFTGRLDTGPIEQMLEETKKGTL